MPDLDLREYLDPAGRSPFARWFERLEPGSAARVTSALYRLAAGNLAHVKSAGEGLLELKIDFGPGYRVYFGRRGAREVILLGGGTKSSQSRDIAAAKARWKASRRERE